jgi:hypothetical protein
VEADATLRRATSEIVLHTMAFEHSSGSIIHAHWEVHGELPAWLAQDRGNAGIKAEPLGGKVKLLLRNCPGALL